MKMTRLEESYHVHSVVVEIEKTVYESKRHRRVPGIYAERSRSIAHVGQQIRWSTVSSSRRLGGKKTPTQAQGSVDRDYKDAQGD